MRKYKEAILRAFPGVQFIQDGQKEGVIVAMIPVEKGGNFRVFRVTKDGFVERQLNQEGAYVYDNVSEFVSETIRNNLSPDDGYGWWVTHAIDEGLKNTFGPYSISEHTAFRLRHKEGVRFRILNAGYANKIRVEGWWEGSRKGHDPMKDLGIGSGVTGSYLQVYVKGHWVTLDTQCEDKGHP